MAHYFDTSALVKLAVSEAETTALRAWLAAADRDPVSCDLSRAELMRAVRRATPERLARARAVLDSITLVTVTSRTYDEAGRLDPTILRTLDMVHLATALDLGDDLDSMVTYDDRLAQAAQANGIPVVSLREPATARSHFFRHGHAALPPTHVKDPSASRYEPP